MFGQALTEGKMLLELDHPNVIKYYDFFLHQERGNVGELHSSNQSRSSSMAPFHRQF
jgi:hypothetical protein